MKRKLWDAVMLLGVLLFVVGAAAMILGWLERPATYALPALGMILIGGGASGKRRAIQ